MRNLTVKNAGAAEHPARSRGPAAASETADARASMSSPSATPTPASVTVVIKNPANNGNVDYSTEAPLGWTVGQLKLRIAREYDGNPPPSTQRIIFSGALLRDDDAVLRDVLGSADVTAPQVFHLVTSQSNASTPAGTPSTSVRPSPSPSPSSSVATRRDPVGTPHAPSTSPARDLAPAAAARPPATPPSASSARPGTNPNPNPNPSPGATTPAPTDAATPTRPTAPARATPSSTSAPSAPSATPATPGAAPPFTPPGGYPYVGLGCHSPHVQAVYQSAYAAAFAALSPGSVPGVPPGLVVVPVPSPGAWAGGRAGEIPGTDYVSPFHGHATRAVRDAAGDEWLPARCPQTGNKYWYNAATMATRWDYPGATETGPGGGGPVANPWAAPGMGPDAAAAAAAAGRAMADGDPVAAAANAAAAAAGGRPVHVMQIHVDLKLIAKLAMMVFFLAQGSGSATVAMYVALATIVYFAQMGAFNPIARRLFGENAAIGARGNAAGANPGAPGRPRAGGAGGAGGAGDRPGGNARPHRAGPRTTAVLPGMRNGMPTSLVGELKVLVCGFFASLLPSWEPPELHRHPRPAGAVAAGAVGGAGDHPHRD